MVRLRIYKSHLHYEVYSIAFYNQMQFADVTVPYMTDGKLNK